MMNLKGIEAHVRSQGLNLYDLAIQTADGIQSCHFQPCSACNNGYSVAKAFVMSAAGLLVDQGKLRVEDSVTALLADQLPPDMAEGWAAVTVEHVLTHRIGFDRGFLDIDVEDMRTFGTDDFLTLILRHPLTYAPGERAVYSDAVFYLMSRIVEQVSGVPTDELLRERLLRPMDFGEVAWSRCPRGHIMGATGLYCEARDAVKLPYLYLQGGVWNGVRLLSEDWVRQALDRGYELHPLGAGDLIGKRGMWGQGVAFSPEKQLALAWHGHLDGSEPDALIQALEQCL